MSGWQEMKTAPRDGRTVQARIPGHGDDNLIAFHFIGDCASEDGGPASGWTFVTDQEPPECWSDGWCWASNEYGATSIQPTHWKPAPSDKEGVE